MSSTEQLQLSDDERREVFMSALFNAFCTAALALVHVHPTAVPSHFALVYYACSRIFQSLEDAAMAEVYKRAFDEGVQIARANVTKPTSHAYTILSAGRTKGRPTFNGWTATLGRNFDWSQY